MKKPATVFMRTLTACATLAVASAVFAGAGHEGGHGGHGAEGHGAHQMAGGQPGKASEVDRTIEIEAGDVYFDKKSIEVAPGETIRFVITNVGKIDHDFTIGTQAVQQAHQQEMAKMLQGGHMDHGAHNDPNAVMLKPGETKELIWTFAEADNLEFGCNIPGHYQGGMKGPIEVSGHGSHGSHGGPSS